MKLEAGARILFHTNIVRVEVQDGVIQEAVLLDKRGMGRNRAGVFVDCSTDADVAADAGVPYSKGRFPMTVRCRPRCSCGWAT